MEQSKKRMIGIAALVGLVLALLLYGFWPNPVPVDVEASHIGPLQTSIEDEGMTRFKDRYQLSAPVYGTVRRIDLRPGDRVEAGETVARLLPSSPELLNERQTAMSNARLSAARATLQQAQESYQLATDEADYLERDLTRMENLHTEGIGSDQEIEQLRLAYRRAEIKKRSAEFGVRIAEYEVQSAEAAIETSRTPGQASRALELASPVDGVLLSLSNENERLVSPGEPLMEIGDPGTLEIRVDLLSSDAVEVEPDMPVVIKRWGGEEDLTGFVRRVEPSAYTKHSVLGVEEQRVPILIDLAPDQPVADRLQDGYRVIAEVITWQEEEVLQVPTSSLFRQGDGWALFVAEGNQAHLKPVRPGHQGGMYTEILDGITEGEQVITHPDERIEDGIKVQVR